LGDGRSALVIYIPVPKIKSFQRVHSLLVSELEKKYNQTVILLGQVQSFYFYFISLILSIVASNFTKTNTQIENPIETKASTKVGFYNKNIFLNQNCF
jgi:hypothetical protein